MEKDEKNNMTAEWAMRELIATENALVDYAGGSPAQESLLRTRRQNILKYLGFPDGNTSRMMKKDCFASLVKSKDGDAMIFYVKALTPEVKSKISEMYENIKIAL